MCAHRRGSCRCVLGAVGATASPLPLAGHLQHQLCASQVLAEPRSAAKGTRLLHSLARLALLQVRAAASSGSSVGTLQKLARVFREKAQQDFDRLRGGTSKTREKLGVGACCRWFSAAHTPLLPAIHACGRAESIEGARVRYVWLALLLMR